MLKKKTNNKRPMISNIDNRTDDFDIANRFADHFSNTCDNISLQNHLIINCEMSNSYETNKFLFNVEDINNVIHNTLKKRKSRWI